MWYPPESRNTKQIIRVDISHAIMVFTESGSSLPALLFLAINRSHISDYLNALFPLLVIFVFDQYFGFIV